MKNGFLDCLVVFKQRDYVTVGFAHLAAVDAGNDRHVFVDRIFRQHQQLFVVMSIDGAGDVAGDFHVLHLILADRHDISVISKDVGGHQRGVSIESHVDAVVIGFAGFAVASTAAL